MENINIYNKCKTEVMLGIQLERKRSEYKLGYSLEATIDKGNKREKQEDSVIILEHPKDRNIKLIAVADGVGSEGNSEKASSYLLKELSYCFESNEIFIKQDSIDILELLVKKLNQINSEIIKKNIGKTTLSMLVYSPNETIIINVGDSRIYTYHNKQLKQITRDDSLVQMHYEEGKIKDKDLMRFHEDSNLITNAFGSEKCSINYRIIMSDYEVILALTDGITDCLSDKEIEYITSQYKKINISKKLVETALNNISYNNREKSEIYAEMIEGGKDNTTAAVLKLK